MNIMHHRSNINFARRKITGQERSLHFVSGLAAAQRHYLPESTHTAAPLLPSKARQWRTVRLRPEVMAILDALLARSRKNLGNGELTMSEAIAALIVEGLPQVVNRDPFKLG